MSLRVWLPSGFLPATSPSESWTKRRPRSQRESATESKRERCTENLSVSVCPWLIYSLCAHASLCKLHLDKQRRNRRLFENRLDGLPKQPRTRQPHNLAARDAGRR